MQGDYDNSVIYLYTFEFLNISVAYIVLSRLSCTYPSIVNKQIKVIIFSMLDAFKHTEGQLNDQFSQLGFNNRPPQPSIQNNAFVS